MMKIKLLLTVFLLTIFNSKSQHLNDDDENVFVGDWTMCKSYEYGIECNRNSCLGVSFFANGNGKTKAPSSFRWKVKDSIINFSFISNNDRKDFISPDSIFTFESLEDEQVRWLKLKNSKSKSWFLLGIDKTNKK